MKQSTQTIFQISALILFSVIFFIPFLSRSSESIPGSGDAFQVLLSPFNLDKDFDSFSSMITHRITTEPIRLLYYTVPLFFFHTLFGEPLAYNLLWLLSFIGAALGAYFLVKHLTKNSWASVFAAIAYSFSPMHVAFSLGFGGATRIEWIPFTILFVLKFLERPKIRYALAAAFFYLIIVVNEPHFALYTSLFIVILAGSFLYRNPSLLRKRNFLWIGAVIVVLGSIGLLTVYRDELETTFSGDNYLNPGIEQAIYYSADLVGFFTPSPLHPIWGNFFRENVESQFTGNLAERAVYIGFAVLFLFVIAIRYRKKLQGVTFWAINAILFSVFAMGPFLHALGTVEPKIPMPYLLLYHYVPFFENIRGTGRIFIIASLCFAIVAGYGMKALMDRLPKTGKKRVVIPALIFSVLLLEFATKIPSSPIEPPAFYKQLDAEPGEFAIMQPLITSNYDYATMAQYYNAFHRKQVLGDDFSSFVRPKAGDLKFETETPVVNELMHVLPFGQNQLTTRFLNHDYYNIANFVLNQNNIKYLILDKGLIKDVPGYISPANFDYYKIFIEQNLLVTKVVDDSELLVYQIHKTDQRPLIVTLGEHWNPASVDANDKLESRWLANDSTLNLTNYSDEDKKMRLHFTTLIPISSTDDSVKRLELSINGERFASEIVGPLPQTYEYYLDRIPPGKNTITFTTYSQSGERLPTFQNTENGLTLLTSTILMKHLTYEEIQEIEIPLVYEERVSEFSERSVIQYPIQNEYRFANVSEAAPMFKQTTLEVLAEPTVPAGSFRLDRSRSFTLWPLLSSQLDYGVVNRQYDVFNLDYFKIVGQNWLNKYGIGYLTVDKKLVGPAGRQQLSDYLFNNIYNAKLTSEDESYQVYEFQAEAYRPEILDLRLGDGWSTLNPEDRRVELCPSNCRELESATTMSLANYVERAQTASLKFVLGATESGWLEVAMDGRAAEKIPFTSGTQTLTVPLPLIESGQHTVTLRLLNASQHPSETLHAYLSNLYI